MNDRSASVVVVTFNSAPTVGACLDSIPECFEVVVVDQVSVDDSARVAAAARPGAIVVRSPRNCGFGAGCNLGAAATSGAVIVFLNPDARLGADRARPLIEALERPGVGLAGPRIMDGQGRDVTRCRRFGSPLRDVLNLVLPQRLLPAGLRQDIPASDPVYAVGGPVPYVQGSCMAITRSIFERVGGFDESFFLYSEEESLAGALRDAGLAVWLEPRSAVTHIGHASTAGTGDFATEQYFRSRAVLYRQRYGPVAGPAASCVLAAGLVALLVTAPLRRLLRVRRAETAGFCRAGLRGIAGMMLRRPVRPPAAAEGDD